MNNNKFITFYKTVSAGNDFLQINHSQIKHLNPAEQSVLVSRLCQPKFGAGADGVVFYKPAKEKVLFRIFNQDGREAELSGNGMAGTAALLFFLNKYENTCNIHTQVGIKHIKKISMQNTTIRQQIEIGKPDFLNTRFFPFLTSTNSLQSNYRHLAFYPVSVGNPHIVLLMNNDCSEAELMDLGKELEQAALFPEKTNVEFVWFSTADTCRVFFFERGVGRTLSSSTGSAAVFAVLRHLHYIQDTLLIQSGKQSIHVFGKDDIYLENKTKIVYKGIYYDNEK
jgi:diaminopimelate epimerase